MSSPKQSLREAIKTVLQDAGQPLHVREIVQRVQSRGLWSSDGKTPVDTASGLLSVDIKKRGAGSEFVRTQPGHFGLHQWTTRVIASQPVSPLATLPLSLPSGQTGGAAVGSAPIRISFTDAAERVLLGSPNRQAMHYRDITQEAIKQGWVVTQGKTPEATLYAQLVVENDRRTKRGTIPRFVQHGKGLFGLTAWLPTGLVAQIAKHNAQVHQQLHAKLCSMPPKEFESRVEELLIVLGFANAQVTRYSNDGGIDVRGTLVVGDVISINMAVQVKRWKHNIQRPVVQQVRGSLGAHDQGLIITTSDFSKGARDEAARPNTTPVALMNGEQLVDLLIEHGIMVQRTDYHLLQLA